jgi:Family of unknown function (DUF6339)
VMHQAFPTLTPAQAADPRLWVRLCHVEGWAYMRRRWDLDGYKDRDDPVKAAGWVREHYFLGNPRPSRALTRNGMARLWWYAHLTYDPSRAENGYELTRVLLSDLDWAQSVLERNFGRGRHILTGFLEFLRDHGDGVDRRRVRDLAMWLNRRGGFTLLDALTAGDVADLLVAENERRDAVGSG